MLYIPALSHTASQGAEEPEAELLTSMRTRIYYYVYMCPHITTYTRPLTTMYTTVCTAAVSHSADQGAEEPEALLPDSRHLPRFPHETNALHQASVSMYIHI